MALRVLLADESSTIKKAIQMVLSDFGVDVKAVPTGIDVLAVTRSFNPDIILVDILLNKKNGYEVSLELKSNDDTKHIPVVLMWSSFMQIDTEQLRRSKADESLEKPFDTMAVRALVEKLVPRLQTFPLKGFLNHPPLPDFEESDTFVRQKTDINTLNPNKQNPSSPAESGLTNFKPEDTVNTKATTTRFVIDESTATVLRREQQKEAANAEIKKAPASAAPPASEVVKIEKEEPSKSGFVIAGQTQTGSIPKQNDEWAPGKNNQFVIETESFGDFEEVKVINSREEEIPDMQKKINAEIQSYLKDSPVASHKAQLSQQQQKGGYSSFDEQLMREEARQIAERICWQIIPEITEKIVREELSKLLQGIENSV